MQKKGKYIAQPNRIKSYFTAEWRSLLLITITGVLYNVGMVAGPIFEGLIVQCIYELILGESTFIDMLQLVAAYLTVILFVQVMRTGKRYYVRCFGNDTGRSMRRVLYNNLLTGEIESDEKVGSLMTKAIADVDACTEGIRKFTTEIFDTGVVMLAYLTMLFIYDWRLALIASLFTPIAYYIAVRLRKIITVLNKEYKQSAGRLNNATMDRISHALTYRTGGVEQVQNAVYEEHLQDYQRRGIKANLWDGTMKPFYNIIALAGTVPIFYFGAANVLGTGWAAWDIAAFTTFLSCFNKMAAKSSNAAKLFNAVQKAKVSWVRIKPMMQECSELPIIPDGSVDSLQIRNMSVLGDNGEEIIGGFDLSAQKGSVIAMTGPVASGKSAFGKVFIQELAYSGSILIDGMELRGLNEAELHSRITYMGHQPQLMSISLKENIQLGMDKPIDEALRMVKLTDEVAAMPEKEDTYIGGSGMKLSGGQQSRLALARSLYHSGGILILDDPFAALDRNTEAEIFTELQAIARDKIIILMTHRLYLFPEAEQVVFLQEGKAHISTHAGLMAENEEYASLYHASMIGGEEHE